MVKFAFGSVFSFFLGVAGGDSLPNKQPASPLPDPLPPGPAPVEADGKTFRNRYTDDKKNFGDFLKWRRERAGAQPLLVFPADTPDVARLRQNRTRPSLTWIGHSTFLIQAGGLNMLTDPHFGDRASPVSFAGPKRGMPPGIALDSLPPIDIVVISHNHYDHLDAGTVKALARRPGGEKTRFYAPLGLKGWLESRGAMAVEMNWFESAQAGSHAVGAVKGHEAIPAGQAPVARIHAVPVRHWSKRTLTNTNRTLWGGFVIEAGGLRFYFAGDTGYGPDFRDAAAQYGAPDVAMLPIGAYAPQWFMGAMHMNPEEAVQAHLDLGAKLSVGMHWGTFALTDEPMDEPPRRLKAAMAAQGPQTPPFVVMRHGETRWLDEGPR